MKLLNSFRLYNVIQVKWFQSIQCWGCSTVLNIFSEAFVRCIKIQTYTYVSIWIYPCLQVDRKLKITNAENYWSLRVILVEGKWNDINKIFIKTVNVSSPHLIWITVNGMIEDDNPLLTPFARNWRLLRHQTWPKTFWPFGGHLKRSFCWNHCFLLRSISDLKLMVCGTVGSTEKLRRLLLVVW